MAWADWYLNILCNFPNNNSTIFENKFFIVSMFSLVGILPSSSTFFVPLPRSVYSSGQNGLVISHRQHFKPVLNTKFNIFSLTHFSFTKAKNRRTHNMTNLFCAECPPIYVQNIVFISITLGSYHIATIQEHNDFNSWPTQMQQKPAAFCTSNRVPLVTITAYHKNQSAVRMRQRSSICKINIKISTQICWGTPQLFTYAPHFKIRRLQLSNIFIIPSLNH